MMLAPLEQEPNVEVKIYMDFARHNGVYEYGHISLALWGHLVIQKNHPPADAFALLNFSMLPYYLISQQLE